MILDLNRFQISILCVALEDYINTTRPNENSPVWSVLEILQASID